MASSGKRKTTMAKLNRERKLRERRLDKQAKKDARKAASRHTPGEPGEELTGDGGESVGTGTGQPELEPVAESPADA
jgi:hypothetical protein